MADDELDDALRQFAITQLARRAKDSGGGARSEIAALEATFAALEATFAERSRSFERRLKEAERAGQEHNKRYTTLSNRMNKYSMEAASIARAEAEATVESLTSAMVGFDARLKPIEEAWGAVQLMSKLMKWWWAVLLALLGGVVALKKGWDALVAFIQSPRPIPYGGPTGADDDSGPQPLLMLLSDVEPLNILYVLLAAAVGYLGLWLRHRFGPTMRQRREEPAHLGRRSQEMHATADRLEEEGDAYMAMGDMEAAASAYRKAARFRFIAGEALRLAQAAQVREQELLSPLGDERDDEDG